MYINSGYLNNPRTDFKDNSTPLVVGSCGTYRLKTRPKLPTYRQKGRRDYQILYVANGKTHFRFDGREEIVSAGHMVLYKPEEIQKYVYYLEDNPEVFWIHFTGSDVKNILAYHGISLDEHVFYCGVLPDYKVLFRKIIQECSCAAMGTRTILHRCSTIFCCWWTASSMNRKKPPATSKSKLNARRLTSTRTITQKSA